MRQRGLFVLVCLAFAAMPAVGSAGTGRWEIVRAGRPAAEIFVPKDAGTPVRIAAADLQSYVQRISGAKLEIREAASEYDAAAQDGRTSIVVGFRDASALSRLPASDESLLIQTRDAGGRRTILLTGRGDAGAMYAVYKFLEILGVRFFHPEDEYVPKQPGIDVGALDIVESPAFEWRGIQQHTLHGIPHTKIFQDEPSEANLRRAYNYVEWLAKNRQNYLFWWWVERADPKGLRDYVRKIVNHAHERGVKVGIVVGMPFAQQNSYNIIRGEAAHSDVEKWTGYLHQGIDEMAALGIDALCIFFGQNEWASFIQPPGCPPVTDPVRPTVERIEALRAYIKEKYPHIELALWIHPTANVKGSERCPNYFLLPKLCSEDIIAAVHTVQFYNLFDPAPTYGNKNFHQLRDFALEQAEVRPVWYWPETAYACGWDSDVPQYWPIFLYSRWVDADFLAGKIPGHITYSTGLEWMYWLNDYAVARFGWDPKQYDTRAVIAEYASIFGPEVAPAVKETLMDLVLTNDYYFLKLNDGLGIHLIHPLAAMADVCNLRRLDDKSSAELVKWRQDYIPAMQGLAASYERALSALKAVQPKVGRSEKPWFDELLDTIEVTSLRCSGCYLASDMASELLVSERSGTRPEMPDIGKLTRIRDRACAVIADREKHYRYPAARGKDSYYGFMQGLDLWNRTVEAVKRYLPLKLLYKDVRRLIEADPAKLSVLTPVGQVYKSAVTIPDDFPVDRETALLMQIEDTDSEKEGVVIVGGREFPLRKTGDSVVSTARVDLPAGILHCGKNEIAFRFNDDVGGTTTGYFVSSLCVASLGR